MLLSDLVSIGHDTVIRFNDSRAAAHFLRVFIVFSIFPQIATIFSFTTHIFISQTKYMAHFMSKNILFLPTAYNYINAPEFR